MGGSGCWGGPRPAGREGVSGGLLLSCGLGRMLVGACWGSHPSGAVNEISGS